MNLAKYYDLSGPPRGIAVRRLSAYRAWVELSGWLVIVVPHDTADPGGQSLDPVEEKRADSWREFTETAPTATLELSLGELTAWALRRSTSLSGECPECGLSAREQDHQRVLGEVYDRNWIRDGLQWLYQQRVPFDASVSITLVPSLAKAHEGKSLSVLVMRCGEWCATLMCCVSGEVGDDQLGAAPEKSS